jgi:hypothetical protein
MRGAANNKTRIKIKLTVNENKMAKVLNACHGFPLHNQDIMAYLQQDYGSIAPTS